MTHERGKDGLGGATYGNSLGLDNWRDAMQGTSKILILEDVLGGNNLFVSSNIAGPQIFCRLCTALVKQQ